MALFEGNDEERTESPSQYRREEFRRQGTVAMSRELLSVIMLLAVGAAIYFAGATMLQNFGGLTQIFFKFQPGLGLEKAQLLDLRAPVLRALAWMVLPIFGVAVVSGIVACAAQVGFFVTWEPLTPKWERLDPVAGFQRVFSGKGAIEGVKAILKMLLGGSVVWWFFRGQAEGISLLYQKGVGEGTEILFVLVRKLFFSLVGAFSVIAALDYLYQRFQLEKQMKMTRREAKEEFKLREGDPLIKQRIRSIQRRMASRRMMEAVPKADVVVTNPTHLAVALKYDTETMSAPRVVAKGAGEIAKKIRELARKSGVPLVENKPLARTMYKELEIGQSIPKELYKAVAEVLAYVYRLRGMGARATA